MHDVSAPHDEGKGLYFWVWGGLLFLTGVEVVLAYEQVLQPARMLEVLLVLSVIKAALITLYFMHLKSEIRAMRWLLTISVMACFALMWIFFFPDADRIVKLGVQ
ncbi:MAG TPA: cytochrome C oxidase subunit IV family protein [Terriglobales bacterium]|nr:cytochrome C oxidase subunit IV family protein [Terriglobales bacterium]